MKFELPEIVAVGIYDSSIAIKNRIVSKNRKTTMFEIEIPIEKGGVSYINSEEAAIEPNIVICAKPGQTRHTKLPFKCYYIHLIVTDEMLYDKLMNIPNYLKTQKHKTYYEIFDKLCKYYVTAVDSDEIIIYSLILELIHTLINDSKKYMMKNCTKANNYETIENVIKYIKENLTSDLSLDAVAVYAGFSPIHFHNFFKASTGKTLREYVEEQRIRKAANMLITTDFPLTKIAYDCGFSSQSYFSYAFKRKMNYSPSEYKKMIISRYELEG